jgi:hypothetical protein
MEDEELVQVLSLGRLVLGAILFLAPATAMRRMMGVSDMPVAARWATRGLGARDAAIGLGTLIALERGSDYKMWLQAGVVADSSDVVSTLSGFGEMPSLRRWCWLGTAAGAAVLGARLASNAE